MRKSAIKRATSWALTLLISVMFIQSLRFKFTGAEETVHIFGTIGTWMSSVLFSGLGNWFATSGAYAVGIAELIAAGLLLYPKTRFYGAVGAFCIMTGAIFFHLFTPLGVEVLGDGGSLFMFAVALWVSSIVLMVMHKEQAQPLLEKFK